MSPVITYLTLFTIILYSSIIFVELLIKRNMRRFIIETIIVLGIVALLRITVNFPIAKQAFGSITPLTAIGIMYISILLGISGNYFFYMRKFRWISFIKPFCVSPIILLPLIGSIQTTSNLEYIQLISFGILAFQNGFFWRFVFERAKTQVKKEGK